MVVLRVFLELKSGDGQPARWDLIIRNEVGASIANARIRNPLAETAKEDLAWYVERYVIQQPFSSTRAIDIERKLDHKFSIIANTLRSELAKHYKHELESSPEQRLHIVIRHSPSSPTFQCIPWEILERTRYWSSWLGEQSRVVVSRECQTSLSDESITPTAHTVPRTVLFMTSRRSKDPIDYRLISKPVLRVLRGAELSKSIRSVRPRTWTSFQAELRKVGETEQGVCTAVHLDIHGGIDSKGEIPVPQLSFAPEGSSRKMKKISGLDLARVLTEAKIKTVVLNACNSAKSTENETTNLASYLVRSGISVVLAMSYEVLSDAAEIFMTEFYKSLFVHKLDFTESAYRGREALRACRKRYGRFGDSVELKDDFVPVLYQAPHNPVLSTSRSNTELGQPASTAPTIDGVREERLVVGRDYDLLQVENIVCSDKAICVNGPGGIGKTAFAQHLARWWHDSGLINGWVSYDAQSPEVPNFNKLVDLDRKPAPKLVIIDNIRIPESTLGGGSWIESSEVRKTFFSFVLTVLKDEANIRLLLLTPLSRSALEGVIPSKVRWYELGGIPIDDVFAVARIVDPDQSVALLKPESPHMERILSEQDDNLLAIRATFKLLKNGQGEADEKSGYLGPTISHPAIESSIKFADQHQSDLIRSYSRIRDLQKQSEIGYLALLSLVPFRRWVPFSDAFLEFYFVPVLRLQIQLLLKSGSGNTIAEVSQNAKQVANGSSDLLQDASIERLRRVFQDLFTLLRSCALVVDRDTRPGPEYVGLHPILPYLICLDIPYEREKPFCLRVCIEIAFAEFYKRLMNDFNTYEKLVNDEVTEEMIIGVPDPHLLHEDAVRKDWTNIQKALHATLPMLPQWIDLGPSALVNTLCLMRPQFDYFTSAEREDRLTTSNSVLEAYERYAKPSQASAFPQVLLEQALAVGFTRSWIYLSQGDVSGSAAARNASRCSDLRGFLLLHGCTDSVSSQFSWRIIKTVAAVLGPPREAMQILGEYLKIPCPFKIDLVLRIFETEFRIGVYARLLGPFGALYTDERYPSADILRGARRMLERLSKDPDLADKMAERREIMQHVLDLASAPRGNGATTMLAFGSIFVKMLPPSKKSRPPKSSGINESLYRLLLAAAAPSPPEQQKLNLLALESARESGSLEQQITCHRWLRKQAFEAGDLAGTRAHTFSISQLEGSLTEQERPWLTMDEYYSDHESTALIEILCGPAQDPTIQTDNLLEIPRRRMLRAAEESAKRFPAQHEGFMEFLKAYDVQMLKGVCLELQYLLESLPYDAGDRCTIPTEVLGHLMKQILIVWREEFTQSFLEHCICSALPCDPHTLHYFLEELSEGFTKAHSLHVRLGEELKAAGLSAEETFRQLDEEEKLPRHYVDKPLHAAGPLLSSMKTWEASQHLESSKPVSDSDALKWKTLRFYWEPHILAERLREAGVILAHEGRKLREPIKLAEEPYWVRDSSGAWFLEEFHERSESGGHTSRYKPWNPAADPLTDLEESARRIPIEASLKKMLRRPQTATTRNHNAASPLASAGSS